MIVGITDEIIAFISTKSYLKVNLCLEGESNCSSIAVLGTLELISTVSNALLTNFGSFWTILSEEMLSFFAFSSKIFTFFVKFWTQRGHILTFLSFQSIQKGSIDPPGIQK